MFDVGFSEIVLILVVALVVIGPEKLPKVARTLGLLTGRVQRYAASVKADVERELRNEEILKLEQNANSAFAAAKSSITGEVQALEQQTASALTLPEESAGYPAPIPDKIP